MGTPSTPSTPVGDGDPVADEGQGAPITEAIAREVAEAQAEVDQMRAAAEKADNVAAGEAEADPDEPVYDSRGNVRPRGTPGAKPMTFAQRKAIAKRLASATRSDDRTAPMAEPPTANPEQKKG